MLTFCTSIFRNSGNYIYYTFAYLILKQQFLCSDPNWDDPSFRSCPTSEICLARENPNSSLRYIIDTEYKYYFNNWYIEMDLTCTPLAKVSIMITAYYICFAGGSIFYTTPEKFGRKTSVMASAFLSLIAQTIMMWSNNLTVRTFCFCGMGLSQIKNSVSYVWLSECVPQPLKSQAYTFINILDAVPMAIFCAYVSYIDPDWFSINLYALGFSYLAFILAFFCPESPRWYLVNGKRE